MIGQEIPLEKIYGVLIYKFTPVEIMIHLIINVFRLLLKRLQNHKIPLYPCDPRYRLFNNRR